MVDLPLRFSSCTCTSSGRGGLILHSKTMHESSCLWKNNKGVKVVR